MLGDRIERTDLCLWDSRAGRVIARRQDRLGALALSDQPWPDPPDAAVTTAFLQGVREMGLGLSGAAQRLAIRARLVGGGLPDLSDAALMAGLAEWLAPFVGGLRSAEDWRRFDLLPVLRALFSRDQMALLDRLAPDRFRTPVGREVVIDYAAEMPTIEVRLQEMFGQTSHPMIGQTPLRIALLSPGGRPVQVTADLPGFWARSYQDVRKDMRGRYPRHPWPDDPTQAAPTLRAKPRGT